MSKVLVDTQTNKIRGTYAPPLNFSVSGRYVIDVPDFLNVEPTTDVVSDLVTAKANAFLSSQGMVGSLSDELLGSPNVDSAQSSRFGVGPNKRTFLLGGGQIVTNVLTIGPAITQLYSHWYSFLLSLAPSISIATPPPPQLLYNWDLNTGKFVEFDPTIFTVEVRDTTNTVTLATLSPDAKTLFAAGPGLNFRLRFTNNDLNHIRYLSDWVILYQ